MKNLIRISILTSTLALSACVSQLSPETTCLLEGTSAASIATDIHNGWKPADLVKYGMKEPALVAAVSQDLQGQKLYFSRDIVLARQNVSGAGWQVTTEDTSPNAAKQRRSVAPIKAKYESDCLKYGPIKTRKGNQQ